MTRLRATRRHRTRVALVSVSLTVALSGVVATSAPAVFAQSYPGSSTSRYMSTVNTTTLYNEGYSLGTAVAAHTAPQDAVVVLQFGYPSYSGSTAGAVDYSYTFRSITALSAAAEEYAHGYWIGTGSDTSARLTLGIGINSSTGTWTAAHGTAWGQMINAINSYDSSHGYSSQVSVYGAADIENSSAWVAYVSVKTWVDAFTSASSYLYLDNGSANGCPPYGSCAPWTQEQIWYVSWGARAATPLPEIYATAGQNAQQWQQLSLYSYTAHGARMNILGSTTQYVACQQVDNCSGTNNTQSAGWQQLYNALNGDSRTSQTLSWETDMSHAN